MKIVCGIGTVFRFAVVCSILGMVLGFALGVSWSGNDADFPAGASSAARTVPAVPAAPQIHRAAVATRSSAAASGSCTG